MEKFILSLQKENMRIIMSEARRRGVSRQELIRAVIIPDWVRIVRGKDQEQAVGERSIESIIGSERTARMQRHNGVDGE